jgi:hypothetical protein
LPRSPEVRGTLTTCANATDRAIIDFIIFWLEECSTEDFFSVEVPLSTNTRLMGCFSGENGSSAMEKHAGVLEEASDTQVQGVRCSTCGEDSESVPTLAATAGALQARAGSGRYMQLCSSAWLNCRLLPESEVEARRTLFEDNSSMLWNFGAGVYSCKFFKLLVSLALGFICVADFTAAELSERNLAEGHFTFLEITPEEICSCLTVTDFHQFRLAFFARISADVSHVILSVGVSTSTSSCFDCGRRTSSAAKSLRSHNVSSARPTGSPQKFSPRLTSRFEANHSTLF